MGEKNIDLRNRLNPQGQREGKQIEYKDSELRVETLLEDVCNEFATVSYVQSSDPQNKSGEAVREWKEVSSKARKGKNAAYHKKMQDKFKSYCAFLLDEHVRPPSGPSGPRAHGIARTRLTAARRSLETPQRQEDEIARLIRSYEKENNTDVGSLFCGKYLRVCPLDGGGGAGGPADAAAGDL